MQRNRATANVPNGSGFRRQRQTRPTTRYDSEEAIEHHTQLADLNKLKVSSLRKYIRVHDIPGTHPQSTKEDLVNLVQKHFSNTVVDENSVIDSLILALKSEKAQMYGR